MSEDHKLSDLTFVNTILSDGGDNGELTVAQRDRIDLQRLGKRPVLKRNFGFMSILGFSCSILITWEGLLLTFDISFSNGGPAGLIYGYIVVWIGSLALYACLGELASMAPTAGGQYHWVSMLAPRSSKGFFSYITGWLTVIGWQAVLASGVYATAALIQGLIIMTRPQYTPHPWHVVLLFWADILFAVFINAVVSSLLPGFEALTVVLHIVGFFAVIIPLIVLGPHGDTSEIFSTFLNEGNWPTQGLALMVGLLGSVWDFTGADGAVHMSEEIHNAALVVPRSILFSIFINGCLGFGIILTLLFRLGDIENALDSPTGYPFMEIFLQGMGSVAGATVMASIVTVMQLCADVSFVASTSRITWSFARDHGLPAWRGLSQVSPRTSIPIRSIIMTTIIACLLSLITLGSTTAFDNILSIGVSGLMSSYLIATGLLLYRRCTGSIAPARSRNRGQGYESETGLTWGPWHMPGLLGIVVNGFACAYISVILFFTFWPPDQPVTPANMNYSVLITGAVVVFSMFWYFLQGHKDYTGPVVEVSGVVTDDSKS